METIIDLIINGENIRMLVILAALVYAAAWINSRTDKKIAAQNDKIDKKFDSLENKFDAKLDALEKRLDAKFAAIDAKFAAIDKKFDAIDAKFAAIDEKFDALNKRMWSFEKTMAGLANAFVSLTFILKKNDLITEEDKRFVDSFLSSKREAEVEPNIAA